MTLTWASAGHELPEEGELVLLYLPRYARRRPNIATLHKGDPNRAGDYYQRDQWLIHGGFVSTSEYVQNDQQWARIPTPENVPAWSTVLLPERWYETEPDPEPVTPPAEPAQPTLFGGAQ